MAGVLTRIRFVDGGATASAQHGSLDKPFRTIQAAVDAIGFPSTVGESAEDWAILIAPGDYDEDVAISGPVRLALIGLGAFRLGRYTVAGTPQTNIVAVSGATPRNVIWTYDKGQMVAGGAAPQLIVGTVAGTEVVRHGKPIVNRISGSIVVEGTAGSPPDPEDPGGPPVPAGGTAFLAIANTQIDAGIAQDPNAPNRETPPTQPAVSAVEGTINGTEHRAFSGTLVDRHFCSRFRGDIRGGLSPADGSPPPYVLATSFMAQYEKLVRVTQYASIDQAAFAGGMTVSRTPGLRSLLSVGAPGIRNSTFAGAFTGPAGSLLLDAATNTWFVRNGGSLGGGATKSFLGEASPTRLVAGSANLDLSDHGITLLVDASGGAFSVALPDATGRDDLTFTIKNVAATNGNNVTVSASPGSGQKIDGGNDFSLHPPTTPGTTSAIKLTSNDGQWWIVAQA